MRTRQRNGCHSVHCRTSIAYQSIRGRFHGMPRLREEAISACGEESVARQASRPGLGNVVRHMPRPTPTYPTAALGHEHSQSLHTSCDLQLVSMLHPVP
jgi:hypothetical protein